jgi:outer membrane protein TolC
MRMCFLIPGNKRKVSKLLLLGFFMINLCLGSTAKGQDQPTNNSEVKMLIERAIGKSYQLKVSESQIEKAKLDKSKAYEAYLPKVSAEASYTRLNDDLQFPEDLRNLLTGTETLLIKEQTAIKMASMQIPDAAKVNFTTAYNTGGPLDQAISQNLKPIPPIQEKNITKASLNAEMLIFSGLKVPLSVKAATHQQNAMILLSENEKINIISQVSTTYDKLAVLHQSIEVLNTTAQNLEEQKRFIEKAYTNGLVIDLNRQKINLALRQLDVKKIELESNLKLIYNRIEEMTGLPADSAALLKPQLTPWILAEFNGSSIDRPDIQALGEAILATDYKRKAEWADYMPKVMAYGKKEILKNDLTMLDPQWYVGVGLRWTIFDGLTAQNNAQQAKLDKIILEDKKQEAIELSDLNLKRIVYEIEKDMKLIETSKTQVKIAEDILDLSKKQFSQGLISLNEHLVSVNDYEKATLDYYQSIAQERAAVTDYLASSGKLTLDTLK